MRSRVVVWRHFHGADRAIYAYVGHSPHEPHGGARSLLLGAGGRCAARCGCLQPARGQSPARKPSGYVLAPAKGPDHQLLTRCASGAAQRVLLLRRPGTRGEPRDGHNPDGADQPADDDVGCPVDSEVHPGPPNPGAEDYR